MNNLLCKFQQTMFANNLGVRLSRCMNESCDSFGTQLSPATCEACPLRQLPTREEVASWETRLLMPYDTGPEREELMANWVVDTYCLKCIKYDPVKLTCTDCDCPAGAQPVRERAKLLRFHCPLKLW